MNTAYNALADLATSATAASSDAEADSNAILAIYDALPEDPDSGDARPDDFVDWVEWFTIPTKPGNCRIEGTVDKADATHDFYIYYLVGDCGSDTENIYISKSARWIKRFKAIEYTGTRTNRIKFLRNKKRTYRLT